jgi:hypothetical protein
MEFVEAVKRKSRYVLKFTLIIKMYNKYSNFELRPYIMNKAVLQLLLLCITLFSVTGCFANNLGDVSNIGTGIIFMMSNLLGGCLVLVGIGFIIGAAVRLRGHIGNPMAVPLINVIYMFLFGLISFSMVALMHWKEDHVFGENGGKLEGGTTLQIKYSKHQANTPAQKEALVTPIEAFRQQQNLANAEVTPQNPDNSDVVIEEEIDEDDAE